METEVPLRKYLEVRIDAARETSALLWASHRETHAQLEKALDLAREQVQSRLAEMNEVRRQINDERGVYATRVALEAVTQRLDERLMETTKAADATRTQLALLAALVALGIPTILYFFR